ncbi:hypothetical protein A2501_00800 [Candidatus Uhrbacteria bacterium RIFOXYC12_FULL_57_11]|nr:MAG: hypothetical protein A2501_00800 [Candidatus Uhrbacteria bacterium RIFOXYC12_FULL_57_11]
METSPTGWETSALLRRHYAGLPNVIALFILGPEDDGPRITVEQANEIVADTFGRAARCTYGGIRRVDPGELKIAVKTQTGETISTAEAKALAECLGKLHILQPVCENGHLPVRFTGPTTFAFQGTDQQCPICRVRVIDPDPTEFVLVWMEGRLGHSAERETDGGDGRLVPNREEDLRKAIGTLHAWFATTDGDESASCSELAMALRQGMARGVTAIPNGTRVIEAMRDPVSAGLDRWQCESIARAARGAHRKARNPFRVQQAAPQTASAKTTAPVGNGENELVLLLQAMFSPFEIRRIIRFTKYGERLSGLMPGEGASLAHVAAAAGEILTNHGLVDSAFFNKLRMQRPRRVEEINLVAQLFDC